MDLERDRFPSQLNNVIEALFMRKLISVSMASAIMAGICLGLAGCSDESSEKTQTQVKGPGGTTTITDQTTVKKTGDNPPPVVPKTP